MTLSLVNGIFHWLCRSLNFFHIAYLIYASFFLFVCLAFGFSHSNRQQRFFFDMQATTHFISWEEDTVKGNSNKGSRD